MWFLRACANFTSLLQGFQKHLIEQRQHFDANVALSALSQLGHNTRYKRGWMWLFCGFWLWGVFFEQTKWDVKNKWYKLNGFKFFHIVFLRCYLYRQKVIFNSYFQQMPQSSHMSGSFHTRFINCYTVNWSLFNNASAAGWHPAVLFHVTALSFDCIQVCKFYIISKCSLQNIIMILYLCLSCF